MQSGNFLRHGGRLCDAVKVLGSMAATARMKEGEPCDLLDRLAGDPAFGMTREELDQVMEPKLYIGRCEQQVLRFLDECAPLLRDAAAEDGAIDL